MESATFNSSDFSGDSYINYRPGLCLAALRQLEYLAGKHWVNNNYSCYANDNWHISPRLILNLGVRYDGLPHAFERYNKFSNFVPAVLRQIAGQSGSGGRHVESRASLGTFPGTTGSFYLNGIREAGVNGFPRGNVMDHYNTFQPRVGFAWDMTGNGKTVLRGGFGFFFERVQGNDVYNAALNPPFAYIPSATNVYFSNPNTSAADRTNNHTDIPVQTDQAQIRLSNAGTGNYSLGIQREIAPSVVAVVQDVGSRARTRTMTGRSTRCL